MKVNRKKKIAIVGAGNAACATALCLYDHVYDLIDKITIYYDPSIPIEKVGQATTLNFANYIWTVLGINWHEKNNLIKSTYKSGILYENWGKKNEEIFHPFPLDSVAIHFVPNLLSKLVLECGLFDVVEKNIEDPEKEIDADFIFDCRGKNKRELKLYDKLINPLNHVIVGKDPNPDLKLNYTRCVATPNGWTFAIPNYDSVSYGYLFNHNITSIEDATINFFEMFDVNLSFEFEFENYIAKNCFYGERTILNGNRLCFLEPLEATSVSYYLWVAEKSIEHIFGGANRKYCNNQIRSEMYKIQNFILWHYQYGSKYDTPFWRYAKSLPFQPDFEFKSAVEYAEKNNIFNCRKNLENIVYGQWSPYNFKVWLDSNEEVIV
jgi:tryptophan halogenase